MDSKKEHVCIALVGNPNCGKSTLFNLLTGLNQSTANFPGATVEKKTGFFSVKKSLDHSINFEIIDLPGIYSLKARSADEKIACDVITASNSQQKIDKLLVIADSTNLKKSLFLVSQLIEQNIPIVLALNMMDEAQKKGININLKALSEKLGLTVVAISARKNEGIDELKNALCNTTANKFDTLLNSAIQYRDASEETIARYKALTAIVNECVITNLASKSTITFKLDKILTHKIWGYAIFLIVLLLIFQTVFYLAEYPMTWIEMLFVKISLLGNNYLPKGQLTDLFLNGVLSGLSGVIVFVPQIALLFGFIAVLEDSGYMARVSFIMDKLMRKFGLNGRSVIPLISGVACAVPAIMSARTIGSWKERIITIMVTPLMSCSARLPVYTLLISLIASTKTKIGFFNIQGLLLMSLYLIGFFAALIAAWVMKKIIKSEEKSYFIMELPTYRLPRISSIAITVTNKVKTFLFEAGKIIVAISIVLWLLSSHAPGDTFNQIEQKYSQKNNYNSPEVQLKISAEKLEASYAGILGKSIEPLITPLGFDWKIGIALVTSFVAREVFVGTMATLYSIDNSNADSTLTQKMSGAINPNTNTPTFTIATILSLLLFYAFAMQCMSTLTIVYAETKHWKWPLIQFFYMGLLAYLASFCIFNLLQ